MSARHRAVRGEVSSWPGSPGEYRCGTCRVDGQAVLPGMIDLLRVNPRGRDISVDSLATELVIDRRLAHGATL
jgi:hypothetical protein